MGTKPLPNRHPWKRWLKLGKETKIIRGKEFTCMVHSMVAQIRTAAAREGVRVSIQTEKDDSIVFTVCAQLRSDNA